MVLGIIYGVNSFGGIKGQKCVRKIHPRLYMILLSDIINIEKDLGGTQMERTTKPLLDHLTPINVQETQVYNYINKIRSNPSEYTELNQMFAEKAMLLSKCNKIITNKNLYGLSEYIARNFSVFSDLIFALRTKINSGKKLKIKLSDFDENKQQMILSLLYDFKTLEIIRDFDYDNESNTVKGKFNMEFSSYITGSFFEDFAYCEAKKVLEELSQTYGVDYELYQNVYVHIPIGNKSVETREIDLMIRFDDRIYMVEVKSGKPKNKFKVRNYYSIGMRLGIEPFCSMLLIPKINGNYDEENESRYKVCIADVYCFAEKLNKMIKDKFFSDESYDDYIEWQKDYDLSDNDFQDYMDSAFDSYIESVRDRSFDEGFRDGYEAGEKDSAKQLLNYQKHIASVLLMSGRLTEKDIADMSICEPETIISIKDNIERNGKTECLEQ